MTPSAANPSTLPTSSSTASPWRRYSVWAALAAFVGTRIYLYGFMIAGVSDVTVYFPYAVLGVDAGRLPYRDIKVEYPPVAFWTMCFPRAISDWRLPPDDVDDPTYNLHLNHYDWGFRAQMLAADIVAFGLFGLMFARRRPAFLAWALWTYVAVTILLGYLLFDRLDVGLTMLLLVWAYSWLRADAAGGVGRTVWSTVGYAALGIGVGYKLIPIIVVPFALLVDVMRLWRRPPGESRFESIVGPAVLLVTALGPFAYYYALVGNDLGRMFAYHADRGLQIECSYVTVLMLSRPWSELICYYDYGSWNLTGKGEPQLLKASTWLLLAAMASLGLRSLVAAWRGRGYDRTAAVAMGAVAIAVSTFLAKVLSPQYVIWSAPMLVWGAAEYMSPRGFKIVAAGSVVMAACTGFLFPLHYVDDLVVPPYSRESFPPLWSLVHIARKEGEFHHLAPDGVAPTVLLVRNVIMAILTGAVAIAAFRKVRGSEPGT